MQPEELTEWRKRLGLTQEQLGIYLGKSKQTINAWEAGRVLIDTLVPLAMDALEAQLQHRSTDARGRFRNAAARYAEALAKDHDELAAKIWLAEIAPDVANAGGLVRASDLLEIVMNEKAKARLRKPRPKTALQRGQVYVHRVTGLVCRILDDANPVDRSAQAFLIDQFGTKSESDVSPDWLHNDWDLAWAPGTPT